MIKKFLKWLNTPEPTFNDYKIGQKVKVNCGYFQGQIGKILDVQEYKLIDGGGLFNSIKYFPESLYIKLSKTTKWFKYQDLELLNWKPK